MKKKSYVLIVIAALACLAFWQMKDSSVMSDARIVADPVEAVAVADAPLASEWVEETRQETVEQTQEPAATTELTSMKGAEALPKTEQESLWAAFSEARRAIRPLTDHQKTMPENEGASYLASNPGQKIRARFLDDGVRLLSGYAGREWNGVLSLATEGDVLEVRQQGTQIEYVRDGIVEWFNNKREGLEHGFIVTKRTTLLRQGDGGQAEGQLIVPLEIAGLNVQTLEDGALQFVNDAGEAVLSYDKLKVWDANGTVLAASMEPTSTGLNILVADAGVAYPITIDPLIASLEAKLGPEVTGSGAQSDQFGYSVSLSGDTALIGAYGDDDNGNSSGSAYVFVRNGSSWSEQAKLVAGDGAANEVFGFSVSVSGDTALVGAHFDDDNGSDSGSAYVFVRNGTAWSQQAKLMAGDGAASDEFGFSVSVSGDTAVVGAYRDDDNAGDSGSAYVFVRNGTSWSEEDKLTADDGMQVDNFGYSVSVSADRALVGAYRNDGNELNSGSAYVFVRNGMIWSQQDKLVAGDGAYGDSFGYAVSLDGNTALIGAPYDDDNGSSSGSAYTFVRSGTVWSEQAKLTAVDGTASDEFGCSVSLSGGTALVGAYQANTTGTLTGSAYVFERSGTVWTEQAKLMASDGANSDNFGRSVSIFGDTALMGADGDDANGSASGSAYVFERSGTVWTEQAKLSAGDSESGNAFGYSVSVSGDTALVGVYADDDNGSGSGSAYVFVRSGTNWSEQAKLIASDGAADDWFGKSVSVDGDTIVIGAYGDDDNGSASGSVYVFERFGTVWIQQGKLLAGDGWSGDYFGQSVSISGDTALVGANSDDTPVWDSGSAYVFIRNGTNWMEQAKLTASDGAQQDYFGYSVSVSGDTALIGANYDDDNGSDSGSAYVFLRSGTNWSQQAKLKPDDGAAGDWFGFSVSISGDTALAGAGYDDDNGGSSGSAYIFLRNGTNWSEQAKLIASDAAASDLFGRSVCLSGDTALIGALYDDDNGSASGSAYVFERNVMVWSEQAKLTATNGMANDYFGASVSVSGDTFLIGAYGDDGLDIHGGETFGQGSAYVFHLSAPVTPGEIGVAAFAGIIVDGGRESFGNQAVGVGKVQTFTISNEAVGDLTSLEDFSITKDGVDAAAFVVGELGATSLANGESTTFRVTFTPLTVGIHTAAVHIASNDTDESPFDITLTGTGLVNADTDPGSDAWETANGFSPTVDGDVMTLDSDGDGSPDIMEIYQGTERYPVGGSSLADGFAVMALGEPDGNGFSEVSTSNGVLKVRYRRSTTQIAVVAQGIWLPDLMENTWLYSGESSSGTVVTLSETVVSNGPNFEIIEASSEITSGESDTLFFTLELSPNE